MKHIIAMLIVLLGVPAMAQHYTVKGKVVDSTSGEGVPFANVALCRPSDTLFVRGATTDMAGSFEIRDVAARDYLLVVSSVGYSRLYEPVGIKGSRDLGALRVKRGNTVLEEVRVVEERPLYTMDGEKHIYSTADDPSIQTGTASDALQNAPGVEVDANGNITLRGMESVDVWINDKPSHMDGESLKQYIRTLPANSIEKIEVITNPSARYGGGTPVVNIVTNNALKRNEFFSFGLNGSTLPNFTPWVSYVFANEKFNFNIYANGGYSNWKNTNEGASTMLNDNGDTMRHEAYMGSGSSPHYYSYIGGNLGYTFNKRNDINAWFGTYPSLSKNDNEARNTRWERTTPLEPLEDYSYYRHEWSDSAFDRSGGYYAGVWYTHKFDDSTGHKLSLSYNGNGWLTRNKSNYQRAYSHQPAEDIYYRSTNRYHTFTHDVGANYTLPFGHRNPTTQSLANELQAGIDLSLNSDMEYGRVDTLNIHQDSTLWTVCDYLGNDAHSLGGNVGGYITYIRRFGNLSVKAGLRGTQHYDQVTYLDDPEADLSTHYFAFTPSLHLSYHTKSMHNFSLSYTHRSASPSASEVTTHIAYSLESYSTGNPDLKASYTDRIEAKWDKYFVKFGSVGLEAYYTGNIDKTGSLTDVTYSDFYGRMVSFSMPVNIGSSHTAGLDANVAYRPSAFANIRLNASLFYDYLDLTYRPGERYENGLWCYRLRLNAWAKLWKNYQFFVNAHYRSRTQNLFNISESDKGVDLGVNAEFLEKQLSVDLSVNDIFNWNAYNSSSVNPYYASTGSYKFTSRVVRLGVTFRFGKMELQSMAREGGSTDTAPSM